ncbi:shock factor protein 4 [Seminavis robusta]|uniref:Shock factor protein 4 n=1 Tax=Seminavis robusta TaxID=568900 RepID=A0A9N8EMT8_9STRA|nr:shock factor protein 4 [Seminavis robusta]|eukprot:Sro1238_g255240.1 shock factor protein 4 (343) ;mRNA; r:16427-17455
MSNNALLQTSLRNSLADVLSELDNIDHVMVPPAVAPSPPVAVQPSLALPSFSLLPHSSRRSLTMPSTHVRPSAALGISSEQLIMAAEREKRMMEEKKFMADLDRARVAAAARQRALQNAIHERQQMQNRSLLSLFHKGACAYPTSIPQVFASSMKLKAAPQVMMQPPKDALKELGSSLRQKSSPYVDVVDAADPDPSDSRVKKTRGGVTEPFPERLHRLLMEIAKDGNGDVISFLPHGRAFAIHKPDRFISDIMPQYFKQKSLSSFQRQLNLYGFKRVQSGRDGGAYYHELFLQGRPNMSMLMRRVGLPKGDDRRKMRSKNVQIDPDFYSMKPAVAHRAFLA